MSNYRPWGTLDWLLSKTGNISWDFIGCVGTEDRSLEVYRRLVTNHLSSSKLLKILDEDFEYSQDTRDILENRFQQIIDIAGVSEPDNVEDHKLLESHDEILSPVEDYISGKQDIILDVSSMPKRFFFPILKTLFKYDDIKNLLVTYTVPQSYTKGKLSKNLTEWTHLPLFSGDNHDAEMRIIGVGFDPMGIPQALSPEGDGLRIKFMFPFPAPLSSVERAWEFVRNIEKRRSREGGNLELFRVEAKNPSDTFDRLCTLSARGQKKIELAPFGPKAVSVAMCLFATLTESEAFYTQPKTYAPNYSTGVSEVFAYAIKLDGRSFYYL